MQVKTDDARSQTRLTQIMLVIEILTVISFSNSRSILKGKYWVCIATVSGRENIPKANSAESEFAEHQQTKINKAFFQKRELIL